MTVSLIDYGTALDGDDSKIPIVCCNGTEIVCMSHPQYLVSNDSLVIQRLGSWILKGDNVDVSKTFQGPGSRAEVIC